MEQTDTSHYERVDERGRFVEVLAEGKWEAVLYGKMKRGAVLGNHYHKLTRIYFYLVEGSANVDVVRVGDGKRSTIVLGTGKGTFLNPNEAHAIRFREPSEFIMAKSRRHDSDSPDTFAFSVDPSSP